MPGPPWTPGAVWAQIHCLELLYLSEMPNFRRTFTVADCGFYSIKNTNFTIQLLSGFLRKTKHHDIFTPLFIINSLLYYSYLLEGSGADRTSCNRLL